MEPAKFRNRVLLRLLASPSVIVPAGLGAAALLVGLATGQPTGVWGLVGLSGVLLGLGAAAGRWLFGFGEIARQAFDELRAEAGRDQRAYLRRLRNRVRADRDPRSNRLLMELVELAGRMARAGMVGPRADGEPLTDVAAQLVELHRSCLASLERTVDLYETARDMETEAARAELLTRREKLLDEIHRTEEHLSATLDYLQSAQLKRGDKEADLARMREELDQGLAVAQQVERRMDELDRELRGRE